MNPASKGALQSLRWNGFISGHDRRGAFQDSPTRYSAGIFARSSSTIIYVFGRFRLTELFIRKTRMGDLWRTFS
jgi:hypothetical protein